MSDDKLLSALGRRAREQREEKIEHEPLDAAAEERITRAILATGRDGRAVRPVTPLRQRNIVIPFALAAAAAIALFFLFRRDDPEMPLYAFELSGNVADVRSDGPRVVEQHATLNRNATLQIVLRPASPVRTPIEARAVLVRDGKPRPWNPPLEISSEGAVRIVGPVATLLPDTDAPWEILVAIGPKVPADIMAAAAAPPPGVRIVRARVDFR
jgi:hypothetical protein